MTQLTNNSNAFVDIFNNANWNFLLCSLFWCKKKSLIHRDGIFWLSSNEIKIIRCSFSLHRCRRPFIVNQLMQWLVGWRIFHYLFNKKCGKINSRKTTLNVSQALFATQLKTFRDFSCLNSFDPLTLQTRNKHQSKSLRVAHASWCWNRFFFWKRRLNSFSVKW